MCSNNNRNTSTNSQWQATSRQEACGSQWHAHNMLHRKVSLRGFSTALSRSRASWSEMLFCFSTLEAESPSLRTPCPVNWWYLWRTQGTTSTCIERAALSRATRTRNSQKIPNPNPQPQRRRRPVSPRSRPYSNPEFPKKNVLEGMVRESRVRPAHPLPCPNPNPGGGEGPSPPRRR